MSRVFIKGAIFFAIIFSSSTLLSQSQDEVRANANKLAQALYYINSFYNDKVDNLKITDEAIAKMLSQLDPHSNYISAKDAKAMNEPLDGNFEGIGVEFAIIKDTLTVVNPVSGGPSERVGIRAGDKIIAINNENITGITLTNEMVYKYLRGKKGTKVSVLILRHPSTTLLNFEIIRDKIPINSLDACYEVEPGIIYLKLSRFSATSTEEILKGISDLKIKIIKGLILDLRGNGGGLLSTAMEIGDMFLEKGQTIVYTEGRKFPRNDMNASGEGFYRKGPLAVITDESSASASEIVAGAVQDWDRGIIIGRRTFGKGLVQQMLPFNDGSQLRLTIARYHTPSGRVIQRPFKEGDRDEYYKDYSKRYESGELFDGSIHSKLPDSLKYKTLIKGRTVYGGGGVSPDLFVPADTSDYSDYFMKLIRKGVITEYMNEFSDKNRESLKSKYTTFESFNKGFVVDDKFIESLVSYAATKGVERDDAGLKISSDRIKNYLKAITARSLFDTNGYFRVINSYRDSEMSAALDYIKGKIKIL